MTKILMLLSVQGEAMARDVLELCVSLGGRYDVHALVPPDRRRAFADAGVATTVWRPSGFFGMGSAVKHVREAVNAFAPDVVHAHGFPAIAVALGTFPSAIAAKTICTFHDPQRDNELPQKLVDRKLPGYLRRARTLVATYAPLARALEKKFALDEHAIGIVPHGVPLPLDAGAPLERPRAQRPHRGLARRAVGGPIVGDGDRRFRQDPHALSRRAHGDRCGRPRAPIRAGLRPPERTCEGRELSR
ncbi:MAG: hypothetical protein NVS1B2_10130 [Vulcanimicrobiaceae bacterium]